MREDRCEFEGGPWDGETRWVPRGVEMIPVVKRARGEVPMTEPGGMYVAQVDDRGGRRFVWRIER